MKRRIWIFVLVVFAACVLASIVVLFKADRTDDLSFLRPYITRQEASYRVLDADDDFLQYKPNQVHPRLRDRAIVIRGRTFKEIVRLAKSHFPEKDGWFYVSHEDMEEPHITLWRDIGDTRNGLAYIDVTGITEGSLHGMPLSGDDIPVGNVYVESTEQLSAAQSILVRLRHPGKDPFGQIQGPEVSLTEKFKTTSGCFMRRFSLRPLRPSCRSGRYG